jgi:NAD(P)-dependent dehydrogenase (short-subunit alcohol dehydrogenase family)
VVLGADLALGRDLARRLADDGATVVRVRAGDSLREDGDRSWSLDPASRKHYAALFSALADPRPAAVGVVHLWSLRHDPSGGLDSDRLDQARRLGFDTVLALAQGIGDARPPVPVTIDVLCRGVQDVTGEEPLQPENASLLGVCTVIPQEVADVACRTLDVTGADPADPPDDVVRAVRAMLYRTTEERDLALRGRHWWARDFDALRLDAGPVPRPRLRDGGVYLITGGLGGVGRALAEHIARTVEAPVLGLLGRSCLPAEQTWERWLADHAEPDPTSDRIRGVLRLRALGARVVVVQADVTDLAQTTRAVEELRGGFGEINGIVHAAGLPSRGLIAGKSGADADQVMAAKTHGTLVLDQVCAADDYDFMLLCSSLTSVLGGPGQSDYAAANAFLDAFAQSKRRGCAP